MHVRLFRFLVVSGWLLVGFGAPNLYEGKWRGGWGGGQVGVFHQCQV